MKRSNLVRYAGVGALIALLGAGQYAAAQDSHWNGTTTNTLWSNPDNWTPVGVPPSGSAATTYTGGVWLDAANGDTVITIPADTVACPGVTNATEVYNTIFGPEWGCTLNIYGTLNYDWIMYPVQNNPAAPRSYINLFSNGVVNCVGIGSGGAAVGIGDSWWYRGAPYVTMNLYNNAQYNSIGGAGLWLGGHLNIYDRATFYVNGYVNMENYGACNDGTRAIVLGGGALILPENSINTGNSGSVSNWIARGILRAYGKGFDTNDLIISDNTSNTLVTLVPLGGTLQRVYFQPLSLANVMVGTFQQVTLAGDYPSVSGVLLSSSEPGVDPASFAAPVYTSSNPQVATIDSNGLVTAVGSGTAQLTASVGTLTTTNLLTITVTPVTSSLIHRYSFSKASGATVPDSVGSADGTLNGGFTLTGGQIVLDGSTGSVQLPEGILDGLNELTIETWASFGSTVNTQANLFAFGATDSGGYGENYINLQPHTTAGTAQLSFGQGDFFLNQNEGDEWDAVLGKTFDGQTNLHIVAVFHPLAGYEALYTNGVLAATNSLYNDLVDPISFAGPTFTNGSILAFTLASSGDTVNYIGQSVYNSDPNLSEAADPTLNGAVQEFRIYNGPLTAAQIAADYALGPNQLVGTSSRVSLAASQAAGNLTLAWPTTSALVNVASSPALGLGAVWTPLNSVITVSNGWYQVTIPTSASAQFFRLQP